MRSSDRGAGTYDRMSTVDDLLLFRSVQAPGRRAMALRLLDEGMGGPRWRIGGEVDLWELQDATGGRDEEPVAVAATRALGDGRRVALLAVVVAAPARRRGIGGRLMEELGDALRARGVLLMVAAVPIDETSALVLMQRARFRPSHVERAGPASDGRDLVWFDVEL